MTVIFGRLGLSLLCIFGIVAVASPEYMPKLAHPYDWVLHFTVFGSATLFAALSAKNFKGVLCLAALVILAGISIEIAQAFLPGRTPNIMDAAVNAMGVATVLAIFYFVRRRKSNGEDVTKNVRQEIIDVYQQEQLNGQPNTICLAAAADVYRSISPNISEQQIRIEIVQWVERGQSK